MNSRNRLTAIGAVLALGAIGTACGGDDGGGGGDSPQAEVANQLIEEASADGMGIDEDCVRDATADLSDDDAQALLDENEEAMSAEGSLALVALLECIDLGDLDISELDDLDG